MTLIDNWRKCLRHAWSVRFAALGLLFQAIDFIANSGLLGIWNMMPQGAREVIPNGLNQGVSMVLFGASIASRVIAQSKVSGNGAA